MYTSSCYKCPLLHCRCSPLASQIFSVSIPSPFHLFRCFPSPSDPVLLPPMSKTSLRIHSTWAMDSSISHSTYTCRDSNLLGYLTVTWTITHTKYGKAVIYAIKLSVTWTITHPKYDKVVIYAVNLSVIWTITHTCMETQWSTWTV